MRLTAAADVSASAASILRHAAARVSDSDVDCTRLLSTVLELRAALAASNPTGSFRALDTAVRLAVVTPTSARAATESRLYQAAQRAGCLAALDDALSDDADDVLLQMSVLEAVDLLARHPPAAHALFSEAVHDTLQDIAGVPLPAGEDTDGDDAYQENPLVRNGAVRVLSNLYATLEGAGDLRAAPRVPGLLSAVEKAADDWAVFATNMAAVRRLAGASQRFACIVLGATSLVQRVAGMCVVEDNELRALALHTMAELLRAAGGATVTTSASAATTTSTTLSIVLLDAS